MRGIQALLRCSRLEQHTTPYSAGIMTLCKQAGLTVDARSASSVPDQFWHQTGPHWTSCCIHAQGQAQRHYSSDASGAARHQANFAATSINQAEVNKFAQLADEWWDPRGPFKPLHAMNPTRCRFIRHALCEHFRCSPLQAEPFKDKSFLDVGCGGGILSEALARMGAFVTGIEPQHTNIKAALAHAQADPVISDRTTYLAVTAEEMASTGRQFDAVMGLEIIEHVDRPREFMRTLSSLTKSDGALFVSTINRTPRGYLLAVLGAEYVARILPKGTHDWHKFVTPEELYMLSEGTGLDLQQIAGMVMNPMTGLWGLSTDVAVNYIASFSKVSLKDRFKGSMQTPANLHDKAVDLASA